MDEKTHTIETRCQKWTMAEILAFAILFMIIGAGLGIGWAKYFGVI